MSGMTIGGGYAALMAKKQKQPAAAKPKASKVMSLSDTKDVKPKAQPKKEPKEEVKAVAKEPVKEHVQTRRELKDEHKATDRHVTRGQAHGAGKKTDEVKDAIAASKDSAYDEERRQRDEERRQKEEEEAKKITFTEYEEQLKEKKKELGIKKLNARKVDDKAFAKMAALKKEDGEALEFSLKKEEAKPKAVVQTKKQPKKEEVKTTKKNKFVKSAEIELGFKAPRPQRREPRRNDAAQAQPVAAEAPAATAEPVEQQPAEVAAETPAAGDGW